MTKILRKTWSSLAKIISDGENNFTQNKYNKLQKISAKNKCIFWQYMRQPLKCITGAQTFSMSKLGDWKHTTAFHKSSETSRQKTLNHLRQYCCYGNWSVIGNRGGRWTLRNRGDICLPPACRQVTQTNKPSKHYLRRGGP